MIVITRTLQFLAFIDNVFHTTTIPSTSWVQKIKHLSFIDIGRIEL